MAKRKTDVPKQAGQCPHVFIGTAEGVHCAACDLRLVVEEFRELLKADK